jgi:chorismate-pyruvate lyase
MTALPQLAPTPREKGFDLLGEIERTIGRDALWSTRAAAGHNLPLPYRDLLAHDRDMTSTIERFHAESVALEVLIRELSGTRLCRRVRLRGKATGKVHVAAAVAIHLENLPLKVQAAVLAGNRPLGAILAEAAVPYRNQPDLFFHLEADARLAADLEVAPGAAVWGRRNGLWSTNGFLAEVVEILSPLT